MQKAGRLHPKVENLRRLLAMLMNQLALGLIVGDQLRATRSWTTCAVSSSAVLQSVTVTRSPLHMLTVPDSEFA